MQTRKGVEELFSRPEDDTPGRGTGIASSFAALHSAREITPGANLGFHKVQAPVISSARAGLSSCLAT